MDPGALRNFKDFLQLYNKITEICFLRCVDNLNSRSLDPHEGDCVDECSSKFIKFNNKLMQNFVVAQTEVVNRRVTEMEEQQKQLEPNSHVNEKENMSVTDEPLQNQINSNVIPESSLSEVEAM